MKGDDFRLVCVLYEVCTTNLNYLEKICGLFEDREATEGIDVCRVGLSFDSEIVKNPLR